MDKSISKSLMNPSKTSLFYLKSLPGAFFFGLKIKELNEEKSSVLVPYRWSTKNPFHSIYFAALSAAAELSTGCAAMAASGGKNMSMLVTSMDGKFTKKAKSDVLFTCPEVNKIIEAVNQANLNPEGSTVSVETIGRMIDGVEVARFHFQWSFKQKSISPVS